MTYYSWTNLSSDKKGQSVPHGTINDINQWTAALPVFTQAELGLLVLSQFEKQTGMAESSS